MAAALYAHVNRSAAHTSIRFDSIRFRLRDELQCTCCGAWTTLHAVGRIGSNRIAVHIRERSMGCGTKRSTLVHANTCARLRWACAGNCSRSARKRIGEKWSRWFWNRRLTEICRASRSRPFDSISVRNPSSSGMSMWVHARLCVTNRLHSDHLMGSHRVAIDDSRANIRMDRRSKGVKQQSKH
jgi:hypothetical protein